MYETPIVVWSNYGVKKEQLYISSNYLPSYILRLMDERDSGYFNLNDRLSERIPVLSRHIVRTSDGKTYHFRETDDFMSGDDGKEVKRTYELLQYDMLFGKNFTGAISSAQ
jgi:hypothetical protein